MNDGGTRVWFSTGKQGSGKSFRLSIELAHWLAADPRRRAIVADNPEEWPYGALRGRCTYARARTAAGARRLILRHRIVVVRFPMVASDRPTADMVGELAEVACETPCEVGLVVPEIHLATPAHHQVMPVGLLRILHQSRRNRAVLFADSQHPAQCSPKVYREARWFVHATMDDDDTDRILKAAKRAQGRAAIPRVEEALRQIDGMPPGHHIVIDGARSELTPRR